MKNISAIIDFEYGEGYTARAERLGRVVADLTKVTHPTEQQLRALAYLAMKGPAEMATVYYHGGENTHPTGQRQTTMMMKTFLSGLSVED